LGFSSVMSFSRSKRSRGFYGAHLSDSRVGIYRSELTYRLRQLGYEITAGRIGAPEIKGNTPMNTLTHRVRAASRYANIWGGRSAQPSESHPPRTHQTVHPCTPAATGA
jgi:hypothetical protein